MKEGLKPNSHDQVRLQQRMVVVHILASILPPFRRWFESREQRFWDRALENEQQAYADDFELLSKSDIVAQLEKVLREKEFLRSITPFPDQEFPLVMVSTEKSAPYWSDPPTRTCFALARWDRTIFSASSGIPPFYAAEMWREVKIIPDARKKTLTVLGARSVILREPQWSQKQVVLRVLRDARDDHAVLFTPADDYSPVDGRHSLNFSWIGQE